MQEADALAHPSMMSPKNRKRPSGGGLGGGLIPKFGGNPGNQAQTVEQELHIVKTRYLSAPKRPGSPSRLRPDGRGWTPVSPVAIPVPMPCFVVSPFCDVRATLNVQTVCILDGFKIIDLALSHGDAQPKPSRR